MRARLAAVALLLALLPATAAAQSLRELFTAALETNPAWRTGVLGVEQSRAQEDLAASRLRPQVFSSATYNRIDDHESNAPERRYDGRRADIQARQALLDLNAYFKLQSARSTVLQSEQEREAARRALGSTVVERYLAVLDAQDQINHIVAEKATVETGLKRLRFMLERQLTKITDVHELQAYQQGLNTREIEARNARTIALERLRETTGLAVEQIAPLARDNFPAVAGTIGQWSQDALQNNPAIMALQYGLEAVKRDIESGRAEHIPQLALTASRTYSDSGYDNRVAPSYIVGTVGLQLRIPIYEGGRVQANVREAVARYEIAREKLEGARREVERDVRSDYFSAQTSYARIASTNEEVSSLELLAEERRKTYGLGVSTIVDVLLAQQRLLKAKADQSRARYDYIRDIHNLRMRSGMSPDQSIEEIDGWLQRVTITATADTPARTPAQPGLKLSTEIGSLAEPARPAATPADPARPPSAGAEISDRTALIAPPRD